MGISVPDPDLGLDLDLDGNAERQLGEPDRGPRMSACVAVPAADLRSTRRPIHDRFRHDRRLVCEVHKKRSEMIAPDEESREC
jgi:hypothetical protein